MKPKGYQSCKARSEEINSETCQPTWMKPRKNKNTGSSTKRKVQHPQRWKDIEEIRGMKLTAEHTRTVAVNEPHLDYMMLSIIGFTYVKTRFILYFTSVWDGAKSRCLAHSLLAVPHTVC